MIATWTYATKISGNTSRWGISVNISKRKLQCQTPESTDGCTKYDRIDLLQKYEEQDTTMERKNKRKKTREGEKKNDRLPK